MTLVRPKMYGRKPKLTPEQVIELRSIKAARDALPTNVQLAKRYGVSVATIASSMNDKYHQWMHSVQAKEATP